MKVFLSYGHDDNQPLVTIVEADLRAAGHHPWRDHAKIKTGDAWRQAIIDGLQDSDFVLAFLSKHAARDPGVCLDELAIALHTKAGAIATILVEPEKNVRAPVSVGHIQWLDMSDWAAHHKAGPEAWEAWYAPKRAAILAVLADPANQRFTGEITELETLLRPVTQAADIPPLIDGFVGREWLLRDLEHWRLTGQDQRVFWLTGGPGAGKSAFSAWITHYLRSNVIGLNICRWNIEHRRDPREVICTLAFLIATRVPDYRRRLLPRLRTAGQNADRLRTLNPATLFDQLLAQPLFLLIDGGRREDRFLLAIDGLDETVQDNRSELTELLAEQAPKLRDWMGVLVTSRPDSPVARQLANLRPHRIDAGSANNLNDIRVYAQGWLATPERAPDVAAALVEQIVARSGGNFLYVRKLREAVDADLMRLDEPGGLPHGLIGLYGRWFRRQFPDCAQYRTEVAPLLEVLAAARQPVPQPLLVSMFGWNEPQRTRMLHGLGSLFENRDGGWTPFHASLRDWLTDGEHSGADYVLDVAAGRRRLVDALWPRFVALLDAPAPALPDDFTLAELPAQLLLQDQAAQRGCVASAGGWERLQAGLVALITKLQRLHAWRSGLDWLNLFDALAMLSGDETLAARGWAFSEAGDILQTVGETPAALQQYRQYRLTAERRLALAPENAGWQRDLSVSNERIGDVLVAQGELTAALAAFRAAMDIRQKLAEQDTGNAGWQRDLSVSYEKIGDVLVAQGELTAALAAFRAAMDIRQKLAEQDTGNAGWQRDVLVSLYKLASVAAADNCVEARRLGQQALDWGQGLVQRFPRHPGFPRDLRAVEALWQRIEAQCP